MSTYTISKDLLSNIENKTHYGDLLFIFIQTNPHKITLDKSNKILKIYTNAASKKEWLRTWLDLISYDSSSYEKISVDIPENTNEEEIFLKVCSATRNQKKLIVFSHQNWEKFDYLENENVIIYDGNKISIMDKDEAIYELNAKPLAITDSIVALHGSTIKNSRN